MPNEKTLVCVEDHSIDHIRVTYNLLLWYSYYPYINDSTAGAATWGSTVLVSQMLGTKILNFWELKIAFLNVTSLLVIVPTNWDSESIKLIGWLSSIN